GHHRREHRGAAPRVRRRHRRVFGQRQRPLVGPGRPEEGTSAHRGRCRGGSTTAMIAFCGYANADLTVSVPVLPGTGARVQATSVEHRDGGMAANAAVAAARVGGEARFAGVVGSDATSGAFLDALVAEGVDTSWTARTGMLTTAIVL